jgi:hypothetical protein
MDFSKEISATVLDFDNQRLNQSVLSKDGREILVALYYSMTICKIYDVKTANEAVGLSRCSEIDIFDPMLGIKYAYSRAKTALRQKIKGMPLPDINKIEGLFVS